MNTISSIMICKGYSTEWSPIRIGNSKISRGIWEKYRKCYFKIHQNITSSRCGEWYLGSFEISRASIYPKYPEKTVLFPVYNTFFYTMETDVLFTCMYFKFGLNTTGLSQSHFRHLSPCSIRSVTTWVINKTGRPRLTYLSLLWWLHQTLWLVHFK